MEGIQQEDAGVFRQFVQDKMNNRHLTAFAALLCLAAAFGSGASAQEYSQPHVVVSTDKVRNNGKIYYSHVVQGRQTLYSISKAYNVTLQEIYDANPALNLETEGLKKDQIILIPVKEGRTGQPSVQETVAAEKASTKDESKEYFIHRVKWFEDLRSIARKYMVSKEAIMNINGMTSDKVRRKDEIKIPLHPEKWEKAGSMVDKHSRTTGSVAGDASADSETGASTGTAAGDAPAGSAADGIFDRFFNRKQETSMALLLPFNASKKADGQMMDFYSGVLLAAKDLGEAGNKVGLNVYDVAGGTMPVTEERFSESDFVIGPVSVTDIARTVNASKGNTWIVSPLDPRVEALADTIPNIIQAPAPTKAQISDMVKWIKSDLRNEDNVILVTQKGATVSGYTADVIEEVRGSGLRHSSLSFNILEGRQVMGRIEGMMTGTGTNRVVIASDSKAFVIEVVRLLYLVSSQKKDIVLYSTSKLRTFEEIDVEQLHALNLHSSVSYHVDYDSKDVQNFLMKYRAIYGAEPSRTAFQGYDLMKFFSTMNSEYGRRWDRRDSINGSGLQSDFNLVRTNRGGYINEAVRRVVYEPDYSVRLVR